MKQKKQNKKPINGGSKVTEKERFEKHLFLMSNQYIKDDKIDYHIMRDLSGKINIYLYEGQFSDSEIGSICLIAYNKIRKAEESWIKFFHSEFFKLLSERN